MQTSHARAETSFDECFESHGAPQFLGNSFNTSGAPIYFDSGSGTSRSREFCVIECLLWWTDSRLPASVCELPDFILSSYFTGRDNELEQIDCALRTSSEDLPARCVIYGMPGVGKTQLALKYATVASRRSQYTYVFWVSAASVEKLTRDFSKLIDLLRLPGRYAMDQVSEQIVARAFFRRSNSYEELAPRS